MGLLPKAYAEETYLQELLFQSLKELKLHQRV